MCLFHYLFQVAFIGISNWALDPAKMNRGILVSRGVPSKDDLIKSAQGICSSREDSSRLMRSVIKKLADGYHAVYQRQRREYFGLRDFYSLVKMVYATVLAQKSEPTMEQIVHAVQRNFGGYFEDFGPTELFLSTVYSHEDDANKLLTPAKELVLEAIKQEGETRYIMLLTKNNAALGIIQDQVCRSGFVLISSFCSLFLS